MKKIAMLALTLAAAVAISAPAASAKTLPTRVLLDGKALAASAEPVVIGGRTYVEFRSLFEALGYKLSYTAATKKIVARSAEHSVSLVVGAKIGIVDGETVATERQLVVVNGRTMVAVTFIAALSGKKVSYDAASKTVSITEGGPTAEQRAAVYALLDKIAAADAAGDAEALGALFTDDSPIKQAVLPQIAEQYATVNTKTTYVDKRIEAYSPQETVLVTTEDTVKVGGKGFAPDTRLKVRYTLHPGADGSWRIYGLEPELVAYTNVDALLASPAAAPAAEQAALKAVVEAQVAATIKEDLDAYLATMYFDSAEAKQDVAKQIGQVFAAVDSVPRLDELVVAAYDDAGKATVLLRLTTEIQSGGRTISMSSVIANEAEKRDGQWLLSPAGVQLRVQQD
ncbi:copper amine oxidase N-terminal domain-containing protein [Cohnella sp. 56]|uniref:copper amine oxidase N-terminal domain-containing protein n=1 Tax=Cohnella sp. 56 TaxID=3113722 RepID=UPI0030E83180